MNIQLNLILLCRRPRSRPLKSPTVNFILNYGRYKSFDRYNFNLRVFERDEGVSSTLPVLEQGESSSSLIVTEKPISFTKLNSYKVSMDKVRSWSESGDGTKLTNTVLSPSDNALEDLEDSVHLKPFSSTKVRSWSSPGTFAKLGEDVRSTFEDPLENSPHLKLFSSTGTPDVSDALFNRETLIGDPLYRGRRFFVTLAKGPFLDGSATGIGAVYGKLKVAEWKWPEITHDPFAAFVGLMALGSVMALRKIGDPPSPRSDKNPITHVDPDLLKDNKKTGQARGDSIDSPPSSSNTSKMERDLPRWGKEEPFTRAEGGLYKPDPYLEQYSQKDLIEEKLENLIKDIREFFTIPSTNSSGDDTIPFNGVQHIVGSLVIGFIIYKAFFALRK